MKILCVGMNYAEHCKNDFADNKQLRHSLLYKEPVIFSKPESALIRKDLPFFVPDFAERFDYEAELVVRICHVGKDIAPRFAHRYYDAVTVGIDFTARDLQQTLTSQGLPWDICKGFDGSAALGRFVELSQLPAVQDLHFRLDIDGETRQVGHAADMIHSVDEIVSYCSRFFTLKTGDLIFTGTPQGVGPIHEEQLIEGFLEGERVLKVRTK